MVGFKGELIHTFNKNENAIHKSTYFQDIGVSIINVLFNVAKTKPLTLSPFIYPQCQSMIIPLTSFS